MASPRDDGDTNVKSSAQLQADIDKTREQMGETLDAIQKKLSPGKMMDEFLGFMRGGNSAEGFIDKLMTSVKSNPVPVGLIGLGLGWLVLSDQSVGRRQSAAYPAAKERSADVMQNAEQEVDHRVEQVRGGFDYLLREQPLVLIGIGVAAGAALGAGLPMTENEDRPMGEAGGATAKG